MGNFWSNQSWIITTVLNYLASSSGAIFAVRVIFEALAKLKLSLRVPPNHVHKCNAWDKDPAAYGD
jgi:hypothetical protein